LLLTLFSFGAAFADNRKQVYKISLVDAIYQTLQNNFEVVLERISTNIAAHDRVVAESEFDPVLGGSVAAGSSRDPSASAFSDPEISETSTADADVSLSGVSDLGSEYKLSLGLERIGSNSTYSSIDPTLNTSIEISVTQPLLKDAGRAVNRWRIITGINNEAVSVEKLHTKLNDVVTRTHETYWEYVFLIENLEVQKEFLDRARDLERRVRVQVDVGSLAPIEIVQAQASVASREELVIEARNKVGQMADRLLRLMNPQEDSGMWSSYLEPVDAPSVAPMEVDLEKSVEAALANRPEMTIAKKEIDNSGVEMVHYDNQKSPRLDIVGSLRLNGTRGPAQPVTDFNTGETVLSDLDGGWGDSFADSVSGQYYSYSVGLQLTYPLGARRARAEYAKASLTHQTAEIRLRSLKQEIRLDVRDAVRNIENGLKQIAAATAARRLAQEKLDAEIRKFEVGSSTSFNVLEYQKDVAAERSNELRAKVEYNKAVARFHRAVGKTLEANGISFQRRNRQ